MEEKDKILTLKEWIESFWNFQEEDIRFFKEEFKEKVKHPEDLIQVIKNRMQTRKAYYRLFKHLSWRDLPPEEWSWACDKLDEIVARENIINETIEKILEIISDLINEEGKPSEVNPFKVNIDKSIIYH
ncbi:MAG: hypothetical protein NZ850_06730 [Caldimicrobium sp.]|nr:hypothetical protein [Caldimicrobium sp.]